MVRALDAVQQKMAKLGFLIQKAGTKTDKSFRLYQDSDGDAVGAEGLAMPGRGRKNTEIPFMQEKTPSVDGMSGCA